MFTVIEQWDVIDGWFQTMNREPFTSDDYEECLLWIMNNKKSNTRYYIKEGKYGTVTEQIA